MFHLESNRIKREFKIVNNNFFASQIINKYSGTSFIPGGNGCEFVIRFTDGSDFSAKGLPVVDSVEEDGKLKFVFEENQGVTVTLKYWVGDDKNTICKQLVLDQSDEKEIDFIYLDYIGITNSQTHLGVDRVDGGSIPSEWAALGQPFYIDSLFFGCELPATDNRIHHGMGRIKYYIGKSVGRGFECPITVIGAAKDNSVTEVKKAFFEYIDFIRQKSDIRFQFNTWYDNYAKISSKSVCELFGKISEGAAENGVPALDAYTVDDGWWNYKADFWKFNKSFPNGLDDVKAKCDEIGSGLGLWLSPRGGYSHSKKFAKKVQSAKKGYKNNNADEVCVASSKYLGLLGNFLCETIEKYNLSYLKLDGFALTACTDESHDHAVGGSNNMYYITDLYTKLTQLFERIRKSGEAGKSLFINLTCYIAPSPWWLQWVNSIWIQNSDDIGFCENLEEQSVLDSELTYRDTRYYDLLCRRSTQLPLGALYNHEPIYAKMAAENYKVDYTDEEFEKNLYWNAVRGSGLNELHLSPEMMNDNKWKSLSKVMKFQKDNFETLKNGMFIGGEPEDNNIYGYFSWSESDGIIALRNPTSATTSMTLTFNKLMGAPEGFEGFERENIYCKGAIEGNEVINYNDKMDLTLHPFETVILKFAKQR